MLFPGQMVISRSLRKTLLRGKFKVTADQQFRQVMLHCSTIPRHGQNGTWIGDDILTAYDKLHQLGIAHSIEVWLDGQLVGGYTGYPSAKYFMVNRCLVYTLTPLK
nr:leucyl/phenylalanyl-tRNA--protein transferase [Oceanicoccus sp. KOV_DT_Chl]